MSFARNLSDKYSKKLFDNITNIGLDAAKTASKKADHETAEAIGQEIGNGITEKVAKRKPDLEANPRNVEEIVIPSEKR